MKAVEVDLGAIEVLITCAAAILIGAAAIFALQKVHTHEDRCPIDISQTTE